MTVEIQVPADDVCTPMKSMRHWLDDVRFDPSTFAWDEVAGRTADDKAGLVDIETNGAAVGIGGGRETGADQGRQSDQCGTK